MWVDQKTRDDLVDFVKHWSSRIDMPIKSFCTLLSLRQNQFCSWESRYGMPNEHNASQPRKVWLLDWEKQAIIDYFHTHEEVGYRRLCYMMLDDDVAAVSPSSVYRVLTGQGLLRRWNPKKSKRGSGFDGPSAPHEHWHLDITYLNLSGTFYYLIAIIDGYSRFLVQWDIRESMKSLDVEMVIQRAKEAFPESRARIITDNAKNLVSRDIKELLRHHGMVQVRISPYYPQSNGKIERWNGTVKRECIRPMCPGSYEEAKRVVGRYVDSYNNQRLHSAIGYVTPRARLMGLDREIWERRREKLAKALSVREILNRKKVTKDNFKVCLRNKQENSVSV